MLKITKKAGPQGLVINLEGAIDDTVELAQEIGNFTGSLTVNCENINRINSIGVKKWMSYFQDLSTKSIKVTYESLSPALVEQFNHVKNFGCGGEATSFLLPYRCSSCDTNFSVKETAQAIKAKGATAADLKCPKCGKNASFDEIPEEYFAFALSGE